MGPEVRCLLQELCTVCRSVFNEMVNWVISSSVTSLCNNEHWFRVCGHCLMSKRFRFQTQVTPMKFKNLILFIFNVVAIPVCGPVPTSCSFWTCFLTNFCHLPNEMCCNFLYATESAWKLNCWGIACVPLRYMEIYSLITSVLE